MSLTAVKNFLKASAPLANYVQEKIFALQADQPTTYPYIVLDQIDDASEYVLSGESGASRLTVQVECYAESFIRAQQIGDAVRNRMSGYHGLLDDTTYASKVTMTRNNTLTEPRQDGGSEPIYRASMDFEIVYTRSVPDFT